MGKRQRDCVNWAHRSVSSTGGTAADVSAACARPQPRRPALIAVSNEFCKQTPAGASCVPAAAPNADVPCVRSARLVDLVNTLDPKLVAAVFGMDPQAPLIYLADHVDPIREAELSDPPRSRR